MTIEKAMEVIVQAINETRPSEDQYSVHDLGRAATMRNVIEILWVFGLLGEKTK